MSEGWHVPSSAPGPTGADDADAGAVMNKGIGMRWNVWFGCVCLGAADVLGVELVKGGKPVGEVIVSARATRGQASFREGRVARVAIERVRR